MYVIVLRERLQSEAHHYLIPCTCRTAISCVTGGLCADLIVLIKALASIKMSHGPEQLSAGIISSDWCDTADLMCSGQAEVLLNNYRARTILETLSWQLWTKCVKLSVKKRSLIMCKLVPWRESLGLTYVKNE